MTALYGILAAMAIVGAAIGWLFLRTWLADRAAERAQNDADDAWYEELRRARLELHHDAPGPDAPVMHPSPGPGAFWKQILHDPGHGHAPALWGEDMTGDLDYAPAPPLQQVLDDMDRGAA